MLSAPVWGKWVTGKDGKDGERAVYRIVATHNADTVMRLDDNWFLDDTIIINHELETTSDSGAKTEAVATTLEDAKKH